MTGLLTVGGLTLGMTAAQAATFCHGTGNPAICTITQTIKAPVSVTVSVTGTVIGNATVNWSITCTLSDGTSDVQAGATTSVTPATDSLTPLPATSAGTCAVTVNVSLALLPTDTTDTSDTVTAALTYTTVATPSPSPSPSTSTAPPPPPGHVVRGYAGKCLDDAGNSSSNRAKIQIWSCNSNDKAQLWTYSNGELVHNGICLNDQHSGGNGSKVILYTCNRALNELWTHLANGEYVLNARGYRLCLDDPASSTKNGTQLIVYTCRNTANQHWQQP